MTLTIGKSFLNDYKEGPNLKKKTWETFEFYDPDHRKIIFKLYFLRAQTSTKKTYEIYKIDDPEHRNMMFTWFPESPIFPEKKNNKLLR